MRQAFARAGLWFFGTIVAVCVFFNDRLDKVTDSDSEYLIAVLIAAIVVAGIVFFHTWNELEQEERALKTKEREAALKKADGKDAR